MNNINIRRVTLLLILYLCEVSPIKLFGIYADFFLIVVIINTLIQNRFSFLNIVLSGLIKDLFSSLKFPIYTLLFFLLFFLLNYIHKNIEILKWFRMVIIGIIIFFYFGVLSLLYNVWDLRYMFFLIGQTVILSIFFVNFYERWT